MTSRTPLDDIDLESRADWREWVTEFDWEDVRPSRDEAEADRREIR